MANIDGITRILLAFLILTGDWLAASSGHAEETAKKAKEAFDTGKKLFGEGKYDEAAASFRLANDLQPNWGVLFNIAQCKTRITRCQSLIFDTLDG